MHNKTWLMYVPGMQKLMMNAFAEQSRTMVSYVKKSTAKALADFDDNQEDGCFVHAYSRKIGSNPEINSQQLHAVCLDVFAAGMETTTTTISWAVLYIAAHQQVQDKVREEILRVVGHDRLPSMADRQSMPYTTAVIHEIQRCANILQTNVNRRTTDAVEIMGHLIPVDTCVIGEIHQIMAHDPIFVDPKAFRPERYLNEDGRTLNKEVVDRTVAFSLGKRQCAGEGLARVELFLGLSATLQHYRLFPCDSYGPVDLEPENSSMTAKRQPLRIVPV